MLSSKMSKESQNYRRHGPGGDLNAVGGDRATVCAGDVQVAIPGRRSLLSVGAGKNNFMQGLKAKLALGGVREPQGGCARSCVKRQNTPRGRMKC